MIPALVSTSPRDWAMEHIFQLIQETSGCTRSTLVNRTGLPISAVAHAVSRLLDTGRIVESARLPKGPDSGSGRPAKALRVRSNDAEVAVISFTDAHVEVAIGNTRGDLFARSRLGQAALVNGNTALDRARERINALCAELGIDDLKAAVISFCPRSGPGLNGVNASMTRLQLASKLSGGLNGVPVECERRAGLAALAELRFGGARQYRDFLLVRPHHPTDGIVLGGRVFSGGTGDAGTLTGTMSLSRSLAAVCGLLNPTAIFISTEMGEPARSLAAEVRRAIASLLPAAVAGAVEVVPSAALGARAELMGGFALAEELAGLDPGETLATRPAAANPHQA